MKEQDALDQRLIELAREALAPPPAPREQMWEAIQAARAGDELRRRRAQRWQGWARWGMGIAAVLLVGIGLGRWTARPAGPGAVVAAPATGTAYRVATAQHFSQAEALLTLARSESTTELDAQTIAWASDLLSTTRYLLDSPAADDPRLESLLMDLELVLAEIAQLRARPGQGHNTDQELDLVRQSIEQGGMLPRLRTTVPSGPAAAAS